MNETSEVGAAEAAPSPNRSTVTQMLPMRHMTMPKVSTSRVCLPSCASSCCGRRASASCLFLCVEVPNVLRVAGRMVDFVAVRPPVLALLAHLHSTYGIPAAAVTTLPLIRVTTRFARPLPAVGQYVIRLVFADDEIGLRIVAANPIHVMHDSVRRKPFPKCCLSNHDVLIYSSTSVGVWMLRSKHMKIPVPCPLPAHQPVLPKTPRYEP